MKSVSRIILFFLVSISAYSQGICDMTAANGIELGDFDMPSAVCIGEQFNIVDRSGGTNIKYIFKYKGQPVTDLPTIPFKDGPDSQWAFAETGNLIILQYGDKNGKKMYRCKVITVKDNNTPLVTYETCNNSVISLTISNTPANSFLSYKIRWSDGSIYNVPAPVTLPYTVPAKIFTSYSPSQSILIEGFGSALANCPAAQPITVAMDRSDMFPRIEKIELNEAGTEATVTLKGNTDSEYTIYSRSIDQTGLRPLSGKVKAGTFKVPVTDKTKSQCFAVGRNGVLCQEVSQEVCTMPFTLEALGEDNRLTWNGLATGKILNTEFYTHINQLETKIVREENGTNATPFVGVSSPFIDNTADCSKKYCYTLSGKITTSYAGYTDPKYIQTAIVSQTQCIDRQNITPPALTETIATVKDDNTVGIDFNNNSGWTLDIEKYQLYRFDNINNKFDKIDDILVTDPKAFIDASVDPMKESYCYAVDFIDKCGSTSTLSPVFCTIFLSEANVNELVWTDKTPFGDKGIGNFEVQSYDENTSAISTVTIPPLPPTQLKYMPNLTGFEEEAKFRIRIIAPDGTESYSNIYIIPIATKLLLPDAFTPNNDGWNDNLELKGAFRRIANFDFQIYNRWGNPIFASDDPLKPWDGKFQGNSAPVDTYTYKIYAKFTDGTEINKTGKFLLIR